MKNLSIAILGAIVAWLVLSFIVKDFEIIPIFTLIIGTALGYSVGKKEGAESN
ncbi:tRNA U-34 5-methylaminomethyl-2-thiouridine biosynthesis protein [Sporosarcina sp. 179-K 8C2 HS]|uniref:tRNA U-34 5-methylaminomethyl-2-thiouridine biosynthesis protein n=1 Tax=Sporosarcina sp. 179-K 8C2 HS TaxID=3142387 RepID=UPI00399F8AE9